MDLKAGRSITAASDRLRFRSGQSSEARRSRGAQVERAIRYQRAGEFVVRTCASNEQTMPAIFAGHHEMPVRADLDVDQNRTTLRQLIQANPGVSAWRRSHEDDRGRLRRQPHGRFELRAGVRLDGERPGPKRGPSPDSWERSDPVQPVSRLLCTLAGRLDCGAGTPGRSRRSRTPHIQLAESLSGPSLAPRNELANGTNAGRSVPRTRDCPPHNLADRTVRGESDRSREPDARRPLPGKPQRCRTRR